MSHCVASRSHWPARRTCPPYKAVGSRSNLGTLGPASLFGSDVRPPCRLAATTPALPGGALFSNNGVHSKCLRVTSCSKVHIPANRVCVSGLADEICVHIKTDTETLAQKTYCGNFDARARGMQKAQDVMHLIVLDIS